MTEINRDDAPEGAQRYNSELEHPWLKRDSEGEVYFFDESNDEWRRYYLSSFGEEHFNEATPRPTAALPTEKERAVLEAARELKAAMASRWPVSSDERRDLTDRLTDAALSLPSPPKGEEHEFISV